MIAVPRVTFTILNGSGANKERLNFHVFFCAFMYVVYMRVHAAMYALRPEKDVKCPSLSLSALTLLTQSLTLNQELGWWLQTPASF